LSFKGAGEDKITGFYDIVTQDFGDTLPKDQCSNGIQEAFQTLVSVVKSNPALWDETS